MNFVIFAIIIEMVLDLLLNIKRKLLKMQEKMRKLKKKKLDVLVEI
jgi:hypothetical protein